MLCVTERYCITLLILHMDAVTAGLLFMRALFTGIEKHEKNVGLHL